MILPEFLNFPCGYGRESCVENARPFFAVLVLKSTVHGVEDEAVLPEDLGVLDEVKVVSVG
jgi:hypothetical protein